MALMLYAISKYCQKNITLHWYAYKTYGAFYTLQSWFLNMLSNTSRLSDSLQWDLVCAKNLLPETSVMVFNFGVMFGAILFGFLSDKYGRKKSLIFALVTQAIVGSLTSASPNFYIFCTLRFIVGALEQVSGWISHSADCMNDPSTTHSIGPG